MKKELYDLTNPQKSIWLTEQFYKDTTIGNISGTLMIKEKVNFELLEKAINKFIERNDSLRLKIIVEKGIPKQFVDEYSYVDIEKVDSNPDNISLLEKDIISKPFNILDSFLYRFTIIKFPDGTGGFNGNLHHLISDAWTMSILINQVMDIYKKLLSNENIDASSAPSYVDYITFEEEYKSSEKFEKDRIFWESTFDDLPDLTKITPYDTKEDSFAASRKEFKLNSNLCNKINDFCVKSKTSPYNFFMSLYSIYLSRVSSIDNVVIGTPMLNRSNFKEKNTAGMFVSNLPNKIDVNHELQFIDFIKGVASRQMSVFRHQKYPYDLLLSYLRQKHSMSRGLYDVLLSYQNARDRAQESEIKYSTNWLFDEAISNSLDIHIYDMDNSGELKIFYDFQVYKFTENEIEDIHNRIIYMIEQIIENPNICLQDLEIVTLKEKKELLFSLNDTDAKYPNKTIVELFEEQANQTPNNIAVTFNDQNLTYKELNEKSNQLARFLRDKGISNNIPVGIRMHKSLEMIVAIIGIIKSGGLYLPIDLSYPKDRINFMLKDSNTKILLTSPEDIEIDIEEEIEKIDISFLNKSIYSLDSSNLKNINKTEDLIYIIYTSGSTGIPKGVMLTHNNVVRLMKNSKFQFDFCEKDVWTMFHSVAFDFSVWEVYGALLYGGRLVVVPEMTAKDPEEFLKLLRKERSNSFKPNTYIFL